MIKTKLISTVTMLFLTASLFGCSTLRPLSSSQKLDQYAANNVIIILKKPYTFKPGFVQHTLPAGVYTPVLEDKNGVYFQSPSKILLGDIFGPTLHDGGIYFKSGDSSNVHEYIITGSRHAIVKLPADFSFKIEMQ